MKVKKSSIQKLLEMWKTSPRRSVRSACNQSIRDCHKIQRCNRHVRKKRSSTPTYEHIQKSKWKIRNNSRLTCYSGSVVLLDSYTLDSSQHQIANGISPNNIHIFERCKDHYNIMTKSDIGINCYLGNIEDNIEQLSDPIGLTYLDFMGGSTCFEPIRTVLQKTHKLFEPCSTLAITMSLRKSGFDLTGLIEHVKSIVHESFTEINAKLCEVTPYRRKETGTIMVFLIFSINNPCEIITKYRPHKVMKTMKGSDILEKKYTESDNILPDEYYDLVKWFGYALKAVPPTWELHESLDDIIESCNATDSIE